MTVVFLVATLTAGVISLNTNDTYGYSILSTHQPYGYDILEYLRKLRLYYPWVPTKPTGILSWGPTKPTAIVSLSTNETYGYNTLII